MDLEVGNYEEFGVSAAQDNLIGWPIERPDAQCEWHNLIFYY